MSPGPSDPISASSLGKSRSAVTTTRISATHDAGFPSRGHRSTEHHSHEPPRVLQSEATTRRRAKVACPPKISLVQFDCFILGKVHRVEKCCLYVGGFKVGIAGEDRFARLSRRKQAQ